MSPLRPLIRLVYILLDLLLLLLGLRFVLRLFGANPASGFMQFILSWSETFIAPFSGIFPSPVSEGSILEWPVIVAIITYVLAAFVLIRLLAFLGTLLHPEGTERVIETEEEFDE